jgi:hypothetical protein
MDKSQTWIEIEQQPLIIVDDIICSQYNPLGPFINNSMATEEPVKAMVELLAPVEPDNVPVVEPVVNLVVSPIASPIASPPESPVNDEEMRDAFEDI